MQNRNEMDFLLLICANMLLSLLLTALRTVIEIHVLVYVAFSLFFVWALLKTGYMFKSKYGEKFDKINTLIFCLISPPFLMYFAMSNSFA